MILSIRRFVQLPYTVIVNLLILNELFLFQAATVKRRGAWVRSPSAAPVLDAARKIFPNAR